jgi:omega-6 fatty acid desaturase (delta-12 desaturase)
VTVTDRAAVQLPIMIIASIIGVWLFAVQHRFEATPWRRDGDWTFSIASLQGSSYLKLPRILQWFTGNIGSTTSTRASPTIACRPVTPRSTSCVPSLSLWDALRAPFFALWDEEQQPMVGFRAPAVART